MEIQQPGQREERVLDHVNIQLDIDSTELLDVLSGESQRCVGPQLRPSIAIEIDVVRLGHFESG